MTRNIIDYEKITNELMREIKESFQSNKTGKNYIKSLKVKTASPTKRSKMEYIELLEKNKETGEIEINEKRLKMMITNKKLPGETEQEFKNKIIKSLKIEFSQIAYVDNKVSSNRRVITGKEWEKIRKQQEKIKDKEEQRPIGSIPGDLKNIKKQIGKSKEQRDLDLIKYRRANLQKSFEKSFTLGINKDFDALNILVLELLNKFSDYGFNEFFRGRSDDFYLQIFSSKEDIIKSSYIEFVKDVLKTPQGKKYIKNLTEDDPLYKYLKDFKKIDELFEKYTKKSLKIRTRPIILK